MIPLFADSYLSFLADILGFCLDTYRRVYRSAGVMSFALLLFHALVVAVRRTSLFLGVSAHLYGTIVCSHRYSRYWVLIVCRQDRLCVCSCSSLIPSCVDPSTKSFFVRTKYWQCFPLTRLGAICRRTRCFLIYISISSLGCSSLRRSFNVLVFCDGMETFVIITFELSLLTSKAWLRLRLHLLGR